MKLKIQKTKGLLFAVLLQCGNTVFSQSLKEYEQQSVNSKKLFIDLGRSVSNFQDIKYSSVSYNGGGLNFGLGFNKKTQNKFMEFGLTFMSSTENAKTHTSGKTSVLNPILYFKYLKPLNKHLSVGGRIDLMDFYLRSIEGLGNNGSYVITGHHFYGSIIYNTTINNKWDFQGNADLGLFSFMRESTSFAFSSPQNALEDGDFNYQNEALESPLGYKYFDFKYLGNILNLKTELLLHYKKRFSIGYKWNMKRFANVKSYPVTIGIHHFVLRYNIINR